MIYTTTDLGTGYQLESNTGGQVYGVANSTGSVVYAFDKSPVTVLNQGPTYFGAGQYQVLTLQSGSHQVGYNFGSSDTLGGFYYPTGEGFSNGWYTHGVSYGGLPVLDINSQGQYVGLSEYYTKTGTYAAFSSLGGFSHDFTDTTQTADNLNSYIAGIPGVSLTSAFKIDGLGRILAEGSDGHDYLLTPTALGSPATVPEPSSFLMISLSGCLLKLGSFGRKARHESGESTGE